MASAKPNGLSPVEIIKADNDDALRRADDAEQASLREIENLPPDSPSISVHRAHVSARSVIKQLVAQALRNQERLLVEVFNGRAKRKMRVVGIEMDATDMRWILIIVMVFFTVMRVYGVNVFAEIGTLMDKWNGQPPGITATVKP